MNTKAITWCCVRAWTVLQSLTLTKILFHTVGGFPARTPSFVWKRQSEVALSDQFQTPVHEKHLTLATYDVKPARSLNKMVTSGNRSAKGDEMLPFVNWLTMGGIEESLADGLESRVDGLGLLVWCMSSIRRSFIPFGNRDATIALELAKREINFSFRLSTSLS